MARIRDLIEKLIAHEVSARAIGSVAEAEAFAVKISELSAKFGESVEADHPGDENGLAGIGETWPHEWSQVAKTARLRNDTWMKTLTIIIANTLACATYYHGPDLVIVGLPDNRVSVILTVTHLALLARRLVKTEFAYPRDVTFRDGAAKAGFRRTWTRSYLTGFTYGIRRRVLATAAITPRETPADKYVTQLTGGKKTYTRTALVVGDAYRGGVKAGAQTGITTRGLLK